MTPARAFFTVRHEAMDFALALDCDSVGAWTVTGVCPEVWDADKAGADAACAAVREAATACCQLLADPPGAAFTFADLARSQAATSSALGAVARAMVHHGFKSGSKT